ncbi:MAG: hypothetical protein AB1345_09810 [Chloroflexota bacterium]
MKLRHPFTWLSDSGQKRAFVPLLVLTLAVLVGLQVLGSPLKTDAAPAGIVSFEFAGEQPVAQGIVESWGQRGQVYAGLNLGLDFLFLVAYASAIGLGCVLVARNLWARFEFLPLVGVVLSWGQFGAALLDSVENIALIQVLLGIKGEIWPAVALWCALPKFIIVALGLLYVILGALLVVAVKAQGKK